MSTRGDDGDMQTKKDIYLTRKRHYQRIIREEKERVWNKFATRLEQDGKGNTKLLYMVLRKKRISTEGPVKMESGNGKLVEKLKEITKMCTSQIVEMKVIRKTI